MRRHQFWSVDVRYIEDHAREIDQGEAWQNYIESHFNIMRRMADYHVAKAASWTEPRAVHDRFFPDFNPQPHAAHGARPKGRRSPAAVLGWVQGARCGWTASSSR